MKTKNLIIAVVLMLSSHAFACGEEGGTAMGLEMDCSSASKTFVNIDFDYSWSSCYESEKVSVTVGDVSAFYKNGRSFVEKEDGTHDEVWREDVMTRKDAGKKLSIRLSSKEETAVTTLELVETGKFKARDEADRIETLSKYRGFVVVVKDGKTVKQEIVCKQRPVER